MGIRAKHGAWSPQLPGRPLQRWGPSPSARLLAVPRTWWGPSPSARFLVGTRAWWGRSPSARFLAGTRAWWWWTVAVMLTWCSLDFSTLDCLHAEAKVCHLLSPSHIHPLFGWVQGPTCGETSTRLTFKRPALESFPPPAGHLALPWPQLPQLPCSLLAFPPPAPEGPARAGQAPQCLPPAPLCVPVSPTRPASSQLPGHLGTASPRPACPPAKGRARSWSCCTP